MQCALVQFLLGYLLGWPVKTYQTSNAVKNAVEFYPLSDADVGKVKAQQMGFDVKEKLVSRSRITTVGDGPYYSIDGRGSKDMERSVLRDSDSLFALSREDDPTSSWPFRGFDDNTLDKLAIISVAGACAEILAYGNAEGGVADLLQLRRIYGAAASASSSKEKMGPDSFGSFSDDATERRLRRANKVRNGGVDDRDMDTRTRFALGYAMGLLRRHLGVLDALAETMERDGSVAECILAIEECPNVSGYAQKGEDFEKSRRERFRAEELGLGGWIERTFLGGRKTIDVQDTGVVEGKGGGKRKQRFQMTGDDPLYAALAVAVVFYAWASSGGLSLH